MLPEAEERDEIDGSQCYSCRTPLLANGKCPDCGRRQTRICFCGEELYPGEEPCPKCGAEWTATLKIRRRRRRRGVRSGELMGYGVAGIFVALLGTTFIYYVTGMLAQPAAGGTGSSPSFSERLGMASHAVREGLGRAWSSVAESFGGIAPFLVAALVGALVGVLYYLIRTGALAPRPRNGGGGPEAVRRVRRVK